MKKFWQLIGCALLISIGANFAKADVVDVTSESVPSPSIYHPPPEKRIDLADYKQFSMIEREMQYLIAHQGKPSVANRFCAVGYWLGDKDFITVVIWKNKNILFMWWGGDAEAAQESFEYAASLLRSPSTDLTTNVVEDDYKGILGTTTLRRSDLNGTLADCEKHGKHYIIPPFTPPKEEEDFPQLAD